MDDRVQRLRHADLADYFDRAIADVAPGTARRLVQVYNGGSIPNQPDHYYLTNPVYLSGDDVEGGTAAPTADTQHTIVVDVLGKAAGGRRHPDGLCRGRPMGRRAECDGQARNRSFPTAIH